MKSFLKFAKKLKVKTPISSATDKYNDELINERTSKS